ncbi:hypothetical protein [Methylacidiphilum caldifontis]|uniref:Lipoprotein n=1 Tax=Methylacidiphilum caldifontis TaxID=2795386 RepID=A0A4Y8PG91_9BACT|nr:hypothetical protein [Methylacidiphilum caldifontis]QSR89573.1 hypothetical protein IT6_04695 [Methylacidiphilum caldifontis]TFE71139.1 hypothetical protein A7Q10_05230 [Methylacidiphilum caldifontis]
MKTLIKLSVVMMSLGLAFGPLCSFAKPKAQQVQDETKPEKKSKKHHKKEKKEEKKDQSSSKS